jgi:serine/threonine protein kinase
MCGTPNFMAPEVWVKVEESQYGCLVDSWSMGVMLLLRLYSRGNGSEGLWPQLVHCSPFPSIAPYFRMLYVSYPKIWMAIIAYPKVWMTIIWYPGREESNVFLSKDKE